MHKLLAATCVLFFGPAHGITQAQSQPRDLVQTDPRWQAPYGVEELAVADFDADGIDDLVGVSDYDLVTVLLGRSDQTFDPQPSLTDTDVGLPRTPYIGDWNGDGAPDVVVRKRLGNATFSIYLWDGQGLVHDSSRTLGSGMLIEDLTLTDLDGDGRTDFLAVDASTLYFGHDTTGTTPVASSLGADGVLAADLDGDGRDEAVVLTPSGIELFANDGLGNLTPSPAAPPSLSRALDHGCVADLNLDGLDDVVVAFTGSPTIDVLLADGTGSLQPLGTHVAPRGNVEFLCLQDVSADGLLDILYRSSADASYVVGEVLGLGGGLFGAVQQWTVLTQLETLGDFDGDGQIDIAWGAIRRFGTLDSDFLQVAYHALDPGRLGLYSDSGTGVLPRVPFTTLDAEADGDVDLFWDTTLLLNDGEGRFASSGQVLQTSGSTLQATSFDVTRDGLPDVIAATFESSVWGVSWFTNPGPTGAWTETVARSSATNSYRVQVGEFYENGVTDLLVVSWGEVEVIPGIPAGGLDTTFGLKSPFSQGTSVAPAAGDFDGDGHLDVAVATGAGLYSLAGDGAGLFGSEQLLDPECFDSIRAADLDGDGVCDLVGRLDGFSLDARPTYFIFQGSPLGLQKFGELELPFGEQNATDGLEIADMDADGSLDLVILNSPGAMAIAVLQIAFGDGLLGFEDVQASGIPLNSVVLAVADFDGDGREDVATNHLELTQSSVSSVYMGANVRSSRARVDVRNGVGSNPICFQTSQPAYLGETWTGTVDASFQPLATFSLLATWDQPQDPGLATSVGELLVKLTALGGTNLSADLQPVSGGSATHTIDLPFDLSLIDRAVFAQPVTFGGGAQLCNALDFVLDLR